MKNYLFANNGTHYAFNPLKEVHLPEGKTVSLLDYHKELVRWWNKRAGNRSVYILDNRGREVVV
jgi:hypothetical protein